MAVTRKSSDKSNIGDLRKHFLGLKLSQKKEFILKLKQKLEDFDSPKYKAFLSECIEDYNRKVRESKNKSKPSDDASSDASSELFAKAIASMLKGPASGPSPKPKLIGTWEREHGGEVIYYRFDEDGSFETNETDERKVARGHFKYGANGVLHMEPRETLRINNLVLYGDVLSVEFSDGSSFEYRRSK